MRVLIFDEGIDLSYYDYMRMALVDLKIVIHVVESFYLCYALVI